MMDVVTSPAGLVATLQTVESARSVARTDPLTKDLSASSATIMSKIVAIADAILVSKLNVFTSPLVYLHAPKA